MTLASNVSLALTHALAYADAIEAARKDAKGMSRDKVRAVIMPVVGAKFGVALKDGEGKSKGAKVFDKDATKYEAAKKALQRLLKDICGDESSGKQEPVALPKGIVNRLSNEIIEAGLTKAQFNELIAQLRNSVSFQ
jgi:endo-1,4-beta-mannosidase